MATTNNELLNRAIRNAVYLEQIKAREVARMLGFMDTQLLPDMQRVLDQRLRRIIKQGGGMHTKRFAELMREIKRATKEGMQAMYALQADRMLKIGNVTAHWQAEALRQAIPLDITFKTPTIGAINSALTSKPMQGRVLRQWYKDLGASTAKNISDQLTIGFTQGDSIERLTQRIMGLPDVEQGFKGTSTKAQMRRHVRTVTRTATNHIANEARELTYAQNSDVIKKVRYVSVLDARTSDICQSLDGQEFNIGEGERPSMHHQCRSTTVPVTKSWREMGIKNAKDTRLGGRIFRDVKTNLNGYAAKDITYGQWLLNQPKTVQDQIFGIREARVLRSGKVKFSQFFDNGRKLKISELAKLEQLPATWLDTLIN